MTALSGVRVLDLGQGIASPFASRILGDLGADVVRVETSENVDLADCALPSLPADENNLMFQYLNWNKRSICLDIADPKCRDTVRQLIEQYDIVFESFAPGDLDRIGLGYEQLRQWNPMIVLVSVTPFGQTGPYADFKVSDLVLQAMSGIMQISGQVDRPPLKHGLKQSYFCGGLNAAYSALVAYFAALDQGIGDHVDLSLHECLASELVLNQPMYAFAGVVQSRRAVVQDPFAGEPIPTSNGFVSFQSGGGASIDTIADIVNDERFRNSAYAKGVYRVENASRINAELAESLALADARETFLKAADRRLLAGFVQKAEDFLSCPQLAVRHFIFELKHPQGGTYKYPARVLGMSDGLNNKRVPAPAPGQHTTQILDELRHTTTPTRPAPSAPKRPLDGLKVIDLSTVFAVPYLGSLLSDLGADVIKVESPTRVDQSRKPTTGPYYRNAPGDEPWNEAGAFYLLNRGKQSIVIDLSLEAGRAVLCDLIRDADILLENFTPRVLRKWGLGYEELKRINPRLILLSNTGYGQTGPWANYPTQGTTLECTMGIAAYTGYRHDKPWKVGQSYPDFLACWAGMIGVMAALISRTRSGSGQAVDISMYEVGVSLIAEALLHFQLTGQDLERIGNEDQECVPSNLYRSAGSDKWIAITVNNVAQWKHLVALIGDPELNDESLQLLKIRVQQRELIDAAIGRWVEKHQNLDLLHKLQLIGVPCGPVFNARELMTNEHLLARGFYEAVDHGEPMGVKPLIGRPYRLANRCVSIRHRAPRFGEHNRQILNDRLGYGPEQIQALFEQAIIHDRPLNPYRGDPMPLKAMLDLQIVYEVNPAFEAELKALYG